MGKPGPTQKPTDVPTLSPSVTHVPTVTRAPTQSVESRRSHALCFETCVLGDAVGEMNATLHNGLTCDPGVGLVFDGDNKNFAELAPVELGGGDFTIALWLAPDPGQNNDAWKTLVTFGNGSRTQDLKDRAFYRPPHITIESKGNAGISWDPGSFGADHTVELTGDTNTADLHIVVTLTIREDEWGSSYSAFTVYRNGESVLAGSSGAVEKAIRPRSYLGGMAEGATDVPEWSSTTSGRPTKPYDAYFKGSIASLTIWNGAALNEDEVKRLYDGPRCP